MPARKQPPEQPDQPAKKPRRHQVAPGADTALRRFPPTELDRAVTAEINRQRNLRFVGERAISKEELAVMAGKSAPHASRALPDNGPRQAWTLADMSAYAAALGTDLRSLLVGAGVIPAGGDSIDVVLADRSLPDRSARMIVEMIRLARTVGDD